jgi:hypothetical protein
LPTPQQKQAARKLANAAQKFAQAQRVAGQGAEEVSGQREVANKPIREALDIASNLAQPMEPLAPVEEGSGQPMPAEAGKPTAAAANEAGKPGDTAQAPTPGQAQQANATAGKPSGTPPAGAPAAASPTAMGTQFVPASPEATAKMMAGPSPLAQEALQAVMAEQLSQAGQPGQPQPGQPQPSQQGPPGQSQQPMPGAVAANATKGGSPENGSPTENGPVQDGDPTASEDGKKPSEKTAATGTPTAEQKAKAFQEEAWFAKLPPQLRQAIRAQSQRRPPRGYEERLKRYFENVE